MHKDLPASLACNPKIGPRIWQDALGALSVCVTFVGVLYLPGLL